MGMTAPWWSGREPRDAALVLQASRRSPGSVFLGPENGFGLVHMTGNVAEWCADEFGPYTSPPRAGDGLRELAPPGERAVRGGAWNDDLAARRSTARARLGEDLRSGFIGFRAVRAVLR